MTDTIVASVMFSSTDRTRAIGVRISDGTEDRARKELKLLAGIHRNLKLRMLSSIGPTDFLDKHRIDTVLEHPEVGWNFKDHMIMDANWRPKNPPKGYTLI